jgi:hypothetical protein
MDNKELLGWFNHRLYPMIAIVIAFFALFAPFLVFIGAEHPNHDTPLMFKGFTVFAVIFTVLILAVPIAHWIVLFG